MAIINTRDDDYQKHLGREKCRICGGLLLSYPFLAWSGSSDLCICGNCCRSIKNGLIADLIQLTAIVEMQRLGSRYLNQTLVRKSEAALEVEMAERERKLEAAV